MVYIIIVTYNAMQWLSKTLSSIPAEFSVVIVDNNSSDKTLDFIKNNYPQITVLPQSENLGFGKANNLGISYALNKGAEYVFLLNQDAYLHPRTIEKLLDAHKSNPQLGIISPLHLNGNGDNLDVGFLNAITNSGLEHFNDNFKAQKLNSIYELPFVNAAAWLLPKQTLEIVGGFDPIFFHYGEDDNYCQRILFQGLKIGVVTDAIINHDRENRTPKKVEIYSSQYYKTKEKDYKLRWSNILVSNYSFKPKLWELQKRRIKALLKLDFKVFSGVGKEIQLIKKYKSEILNSRAINITKGRHYL